MFVWLFAAMSILWVETLFRDSEYYGYIILSFAVLYIFCMVMFMCGLRKASTENMRYWENKNMQYLTDMVSKGLGEATYIIPIGEPEGDIRKWRTKLFGTQYICPYVATFLDTGIVHQKAHIEIPITKRQQFQLKLMGCYKTQDRQRALKALEYLEIEWPLP